MISIAARKAKGRRLQQWAAKQVSKATGFEYGMDCEISSRPMGQSGTDVRLEKQVLKMFPYSIECKAQETWAVPSWIVQTKKNTFPDTEWLLVMKKNGQDPVVAVDGKHFFELMKELIKYREAEENV